MSHHVRIASLVGLAVLGAASTASAQSSSAPLPPRVGFEGGFGLYAGEINCENENGDFCNGVSEAGGLDGHLNYFFNPKLGIFGDVFVMAHSEDDWTRT